MALTSADAPGADKPTPKAAAAAKAAPATTELAKAGHSGDPAVHQLMANRWTAEQNGDTAGVAAADRALAALGFTI